MDSALQAFSRLGFLVPNHTEDILAFCEGKVRKDYMQAE